MKRFWEKVQDKLADPYFMLPYYAWNVALWIVMMPTAIFTGWVNSPAFISVLSIYALAAAFLVGVSATLSQIDQQQSEARLTRAIEENTSDQSQ